MNRNLNWIVSFFLTLAVSLSLSNEAWAKTKHRKHHSQSADSYEDGLCIQKNQNKVQAIGKNSYCSMLRQIVDDPKSCAHQAISKLVTSNESVNGLGQFCSDYSSLDSGTDFYYQLLSVMAYSESRWRPTGTGDHGNSKGLMQISVSDRGNYSDCNGLTAKNIYDPYTNLKCGSCIAMTWLAKDKEMGSGHAGTRKARGLARYFGPFGSQAGAIRSEISNATNRFCNGNSHDQLQYASLGGGRRSPASNGRIQMAYATGLASH